MNTHFDADTLCISAYGAVTPLGSNLDEIHASFINEKSGIREIKKFDHRYFETHEAGIPVEGNAAISWPKKSPFRNGELFYAGLAAKRLHDRLRLSAYYSVEEIGCIVGIDEPAIDIELCIGFSEKVPADADKQCLVDAALEHFKIGDFLDLDTTAVLKTIHDIIPFAGLSFAHLGLCSASTQSIGLAMRAIRSGEIKVAICGGVSAKVTPLNLARLEGMGVISTDEHYSGTGRSRPFDRHRSGFVLAEGAGLFVIEKLSSVLARQDKPLAYLLGYGGALCAQHIVMPHQDDLEMQLSMERAIEHAGIDRNTIDFVNTHGTSTLQNDQHEASAIRKVFGEHNPAIVATKSYHGHLIAAAGAMEILGVLVSFQHDLLPKILNCDEPDPQLPDGIALVNEHQHRPLKYALKNSFGMGGGAGSLVLGNPKYL